MKRGFTLFEMLIAGLLLATIFVSVVPTLGWIVRQRREIDRRQAALVAAENLLERLSSLPWPEMTAERAAQLATPELLPDNLPDAVCHATVEDDEAHSKKLAVKLAWRDATGKRPAPVRLTTWVYRSEEAR